MNLICWTWTRREQWENYNRKYDLNNKFQNKPNTLAKFTAFTLYHARIRVYRFIFWKNVYHFNKKKKTNWNGYTVSKRALNYVINYVVYPFNSFIHSFVNNNNSSCHRSSSSSSRVETAFIVYHFMCVHTNLFARYGSGWAFWISSISPFYKIDKENDGSHAYASNYINSITSDLCPITFQQIWIHNKMNFFRYADDDRQLPLVSNHWSMIVQHLIGL